MRKIFGILLMSVFFFAGCVQSKPTLSNKKSSLENPPKLTANVGNKSITAVVGTYSWNIDNGDGTSSFNEADSAGPPELIMYQKEKLTVQSGDIINLSFSHKPDDYKVSIWENNNPVVQWVNDGKIIVPQKKGLIVYEVYAKYKEGNAHYAFFVNENDSPVENGTTVEQVSGENSNIVLVVSNQSFEKPDINLKVFIDDKFYIDNQFKVEDQHNFASYNYSIPKGSHKLKAIVNNTSIFEEIFNMNNEKQWAVITYWYNSRDDINFNISTDKFRVK